MKILAVDDSITMLKLIKKTLTDMGYTDIILCESGNGALEILDQQSVDLILLDWHMPGLTGLDFLRIVKNSDAAKNIPVVMLTTENHPMSIKSAQESGANAYLIKPISPETFSLVTHRLFGQSKAV